MKIAVALTSSAFVAVFLCTGNELSTTVDNIAAAASCKILPAFSVPDSRLQRKSSGVRAEFSETWGHTKGHFQCRGFLKSDSGCWHFDWWFLRARVVHFIAVQKENAGRAVPLPRLFSNEGKCRSDVLYAHSLSTTMNPPAVQMPPSPSHQSSITQSLCCTIALLNVPIRISPAILHLPMHIYAYTTGYLDQIPPRTSILEYILGENGLPFSLSIREFESKTI